MVTAAQRIRLGIFLAVAATLLVITLGVVAGSKLLERRDQYSIRYRDISVGGLETGADVKYSGIRVGRVDDIRIDPADVTAVIVDISVREGTPIKEDSEASIVTMGITSRSGAGRKSRPSFPRAARFAPEFRPSMRSAAARRSWPRRSNRSSTT